MRIDTTEIKRIRFNKFQVVIVIVFIVGIVMGAAWNYSEVKHCHAEVEFYKEANYNLSISQNRLPYLVEIDLLNGGLK
jgi:hypothetical protein